MNVELKAPVKHSQTNEEFNFDLEKIKKAVESEKVKVPPTKSLKDFDKWLELD
ncbi:MAG: hypothetical protein ACI8WB_005407 [Phenylobacterium sp.]|jgi:hypothetical protein